MSGIDWSEIETGHRGNTLIKATEIVPKQMGNSPVSIPNQALSSVAIGGVKATGRTAVAAIPVAAVVEVVNTALNIFDHAIQVYGQITVEKERTKQIQAMAGVQETLAREQTKQVEIQARERTAAIAIQAKLECENKRMELQKYSIELENEKHKREISQEKWRDGYRIIYESVNSLNGMRNDIWQQMKKSNFGDDNLRQQFSDISRDIDGCLGKLIALGKMLAVE